MDGIIDKFYNQSLKPNNKSLLTNNKFSSPNLLGNKYSINNLNDDNKNKRYNNKEGTIMSSPMPKTTYSMGLQAPTVRGSPPSAYSTTVPYRIKNENDYSNLQKNYTPNIFKLNTLNNRIKQLEEDNKRDQLRIKRLIEGNNLFPDERNSHNRTTMNSNQNYMNNPQSLDEAINNLRNPCISVEDLSQKQAIRRDQVQMELTKAREKMVNDKLMRHRPREINPNPSINVYPISHYSEESQKESSSSSSVDESNSKSNIGKIDNHLIDYVKLRKAEKKREREREREMEEMDDKLEKVIKQNYYNNKELNKLRLKNEEMFNAIRSKEEAQDFMNTIPDHVALQLQNDNFKVRSNINAIKNGFRAIKNDLEDKLETLQMKQNQNFEVIRNIIETGGNKKLKAGFRKYIDGEDIDLNNIQEDYPKYLTNINELIDRKIRENEEKKNKINEQNRKITEEMNKKYDMMEYKYGYANSFYDYKNNNRPNNYNNQTQNNNNNFVISKNYGRFQYIRNNSKNQPKRIYNGFRQEAGHNLQINRQKGNKIPGKYASGVGDRYMDYQIPIRMNGCFDDWYKSKKNGDDNKNGKKKNDGEEFQVLDTGSEVGINAIKKRVNSKSEKDKSKSEKSKKDSKKDKDKKNEKSEKSKKSTVQTKSSKNKSKKRKSKVSKDTKKDEEKKNGKKKDVKKKDEKKKLK